MLFREFCELDEVSFVVGEIRATITAVPLEKHEEVLLEHADQELLNFIRDRVTQFAHDVMGLRPSRNASLVKPSGFATAKEKATEPKTELKKFRVTLRYPKSKRKAHLGHYQPYLMYVYANSINDAKKRAEEYIRYKLEPVENDETRRYPRHNYIKDIKRKHMDLNVKKVDNWDDLVGILKHITDKHGDLTPLDYFDEKDLKIVLQQAKSKDFPKALGKLSLKEKKLLKRMYFHMAQSPWLDPETKKLLDGSLDKTMRKLSREPEEATFNPAEFERSDWNYQSVFEPKTEEEEQALLNDIVSVKDAYEAARRFGIPAKDLRDHANKRFGEEDKTIDAERLLYRYLRKKIKISPKAKIIQEGDYSNPALFDKYGLRWDELMDDLLNNHETYGEAFPFVDPKDPNNTEVESEASDWTWDFYKNGMPAKPSKVDRLKKTLQELIDYRDRIRAGEKTFNTY